MFRTGLLCFFILAAFFGWVLGVPVLAIDDQGLARQLAASANDHAKTVAEQQEALKKLEEASSLFIRAGQAVEAARVKNRVGRLQLRLNTPQTALDSYNQALTLLKTNPTTDVEVDSLNGLGAAHLVLKNMKEGSEVIQRSLMLSEQSGYTAGQAQALLTLSEFQNFDDHVLALTTAQRALRLWQTLEDKPGLARTYSQIGRCSMAQSLLPEATQNYETALQLWRELNDQSGQAAALVMLGFIEHRKAEWQNAISYLIQARGLIDEEAEPRRMGQISSGLGSAFNENGLPEYGLIHYQQELSYVQRTQDPRAIRLANQGIAKTHYLLRNYDEAERRFQEVLSGVPADSLDATGPYEYLGRICLERNEYPAALEHFQKALTIFIKAHNPREAAQMRGLIGQVYQQQGQLGQAQQYYRQALATFGQLSDRLNQAVIYYALGRLELNAGNLDAAEDYLARSIQFTENIRRFPTSSDLTAAFSARVYERYESYIECLMRKHQARPEQGFAIRALETSELARGRSLTELLRATQTDVSLNLDPELARQEKLLRQSLRIKENDKITLLSKEHKKDDLAALDAEVAKLESGYKQVIETIRARFPSYEQITRPTAWDVRRIQEEVVADDQTVLIEYVLGKNRSYVWTITRNDVKSYELPDQSQINNAVQRVYQLLTTAEGAKGEDLLRAATRGLSEMVLPRAAPELNKPRWIVVADRALNYVPFQILSRADADEPLVTNTEIIYGPSASILGQLREETARRQAPKKVLVAFGDPVFESNYAQSKNSNTNNYIASVQTGRERWQHALRDIEPTGDSTARENIQPLFYAKRELVNLREVAGRDAFVLSGFDATPEKLQSTNLGEYAILHFATHGILNSKHPENSGLFMSMVNRDGQPQNGFVGLQDIYRLRAPVDLVVLSACRTGLGKDVRGEGLIGLTRGFMYAGASSVVASLWKVDDEATAELMRHFYVNMLREGMAPAAALRAAQNRIRQEPRWHAPYYWAAFTLQGEYRQVITATPSHEVAAFNWKLITALAVALLLIGSGMWWWRRRVRI